MHRIFMRIDLGMMYHQCVNMVQKLMNPNFSSAQLIFKQDERVVFVNKLFGKLSMPQNEFEYEDTINTIMCINNMLQKIELRKLSAVISTEKIIREQLMEEEKQFQQFMDNLFNLYQEYVQQHELTTTSQKNRYQKQYIESI